MQLCIVPWEWKPKSASINTTVQFFCNLRSGFLHAQTATRCTSLRAALSPSMCSTALYKYRRRNLLICINTRMGFLFPCGRRHISLPPAMPRPSIGHTITRRFYALSGGTGRECVWVITVMASRELNTKIYVIREKQGSFLWTNWALYVSTTERTVRTAFF